MHDLNRTICKSNTLNPHFLFELVWEKLLMAWI